MYKGSELTDLGKQLSSSFLQDGKNLTTQLQKVASDRGLTKPQVDRVAEVANVETYLNLIKEGEQSYIDFDVADPTVVKAENKIKKTAVVNSDYEKAPEYEFSMDSFFGTDFSEDPSPDKAAMRKHAQEVKGKMQFLNDRLSEATTSYQWKIQAFSDLVKQAHLRDQVSIDQLHYISKQAAPNSSDHFWPIVESRLSKSHISHDGDYSDFDKSVNPESGIYKAAQVLEASLVKTAQIKTASDFYENELKTTPLYETHLLHNLEKVGGVVSGTIEFIGNHPKLSGATVIAGAGYKAGKNKGRMEQGEILRDNFVNVKDNKAKRGF